MSGSQLLSDSKVISIPDGFKDDRISIPSTFPVESLQLHCKIKKKKISKTNENSGSLLKKENLCRVGEQNIKRVKLCVRG